MSADAVTVWLNQLQAGESAAARPLWEKYFHRLVGLARTRLRGAALRASDEDVALSAFDSFCRNAEAGRFPELTDRDSLWQLLAAFTLRKAAHHIRDALALKRGGGKAPAAGPGVLEEALGREPDPALAAEMAEECERLLAALGDPELRQIALLRMDGRTVEEVAAAIPCSTPTVKRRLKLIRGIWEREGRHELS